MNNTKCYLIKCKCWLAVGGARVGVGTERL